MIDDRIDAGSDDEIGDIADDVIFVRDGNDDADDSTRPVTESIWTSVVSGAHYAFRRVFSRAGGQDGTGAG